MSGAGVSARASVGSGGGGRAIEDLAVVRAVVSAKLAAHRVRVLLFGSWARGEAREGSDIDVAVLPVAPLPVGLLAELREELEEASVVARVDVVDLREASPELRRAVEREGVPWIE